MIGLTLIMDVIKAGSGLLINLPHWQRVKIIEAFHRTTTAPLTHRGHGCRKRLVQSLSLLSSQKQQPQLKEG